MKKTILIALMLLGLGTSANAYTLEEIKAVCDNGNMGGCFILGSTYDGGRGVKQDYFKL